MYIITCSISALGSIKEWSVFDRSLHAKFGSSWAFRPIPTKCSLRFTLTYLHECCIIVQNRAPNFLASFSSFWPWKATNFYAAKPLGVWLGKMGAIFIMSARLGTPTYLLAASLMASVALIPFGSFPSSPSLPASSSVLRHWPICSSSCPLKLASIHLTNSSLTQSFYKLSLTQTR